MVPSTSRGKRGLCPRKLQVQNEVRYACLSHHLFNVTILFIEKLVYVSYFFGLKIEIDSNYNS